MIEDLIQTTRRRPSDPCASFAPQLVVGDWVLCREFEAHWYGADGVLFRCINVKTLQPGVVMLHPDQAAPLQRAAAGLWGETLARLRAARKW